MDPKSPNSSPEKTKDHSSTRIKKTREDRIALEVEGGEGTEEALQTEEVMAEETPEGEGEEEEEGEGEEEGVGEGEGEEKEEEPNNQPL